MAFEGVAVVDTSGFEEASMLQNPPDFVVGAAAAVGGCAEDEEDAIKNSVVDAIRLMPPKIFFLVGAAAEAFGAGSAVVDVVGFAAATRGFDDGARLMPPNIFSWR